MNHVRGIGGVIVLLLGLATSALARGTGDIVGRVTGASGGVLHRVTVTATNRGTSISRTTVTSETGDFTFTLLHSEFAIEGPPPFQQPASPGGRHVRMRPVFFRFTVNTAT